MSIYDPASYDIRTAVPPMLGRVRTAFSEELEARLAPFDLKAVADRVRGEFLPAEPLEADAGTVVLTETDSGDYQATGTVIRPPTTSSARSKS